MASVMRLERMMAYRKMPLGKLAERVGICLLYTSACSRRRRDGAAGS